MNNPMPILLEHFLTYTLSERNKNDVNRWLNSNSATVIVDQLRKAVNVGKR